MSLRFAYNTNGTANHRLEDAIALIAEAGYQGVALTLDHHHLDPFAPDFHGRATVLARRFRTLGLGSVIETGARYLLDPRAKHEPTLLSPEPAGRARRVDFLGRAIEAAGILGSEAVSFWAGVPRAGVAREDAWDWLLEGLAQVAALAKAAGVTIALEPEPGMLVETVGDYRRVAREIPALTLALDTGHCLVTEDIDPVDAVHEMALQIGTVAIEDMKRGAHIHLPFGEGDMDLPAVLAALDEIGFERLVCVELSRESHRADTMVAQAMRYIRSCRPND